MNTLIEKLDKAWNDDIDLQSNILNIFTIDFTFRFFFSASMREYSIQKQLVIDELKKVFEDKNTRLPIEERIFWKILDLIDEIGVKKANSEVCIKLSYVKDRIIKLKPDLNKVELTRCAAMMNDIIAKCQRDMNGFTMELQ